MRENFRKEVLDNGFTILHEKRDVPVVSASISVRAGGINESLGEKGISHYIEHMLYRGTKNFSAKEIAQIIEKKGGELNGFTADTTTSFWCKVPSKHFYVALDILSDIVKYPLFDLKDLEQERKIIFEEIKMRKDNPRQYVFDKVQNFLYGGTLSKDLIGDEKTMNSISRRDLVKKFKETYTPNNLILTVVGNCDFEDLLAWVKKKFSSKKKGKVSNQKITLKNKQSLEKREGIDQANLVLAYHSPLAQDKHVYAAEVLLALMSEGLSSRLFQEIREKRHLAYSIHGTMDSDKRYAHSLIYVGCRSENVLKVKDLILKEFAKVSKSLSQKELKEIKEQLIGNYQISMEDSQSQMIQLLIHEIIGDASDFYEFEKNVSNVTLKQVKDLAGKVKEGNYSFFALVPKNSNLSNEIFN